MNIIIEDPLNSVSKTQRKKIRQMVMKVWDIDEQERFHDDVDRILENIHYEDDTKKYNVCKFDYTDHNKRLVLYFDKVHIQTKEDRRKELLEKLHSKLKVKKHATDPQWQMYEKLKSRMPEANKNMIPTPDQVKNNLEMYRTMMTMIPNQNPLHEYLAMFIPTT